MGGTPFGLEQLRAMSWSIVGAGRVGKTLGLLARSLDIPIGATWNRSAPAAAETSELLDPAHALDGSLDEIGADLVGEADIVWLTVVDDAIGPAAESLAEHLRADQIVLHTAGSLSSSILAEAGVEASVGSLHPLQAITVPTTAVDYLARAAWTVEGDAPAIDYAAGLMAQLGVRPHEISSETKTLYHASAVTTANLMVALMDAAFAMAEAAGIERGEARNMLLPLARSCVDNLGRQDTAEALSGPAARGDMATIERHLEALRGLDDEQLAEIYELLTARARGLVEGE